MQPPKSHPVVEMLDVYTHFGQASAWSQALETGLCVLLLTAHRVTDPTMTSEQEAQKRHEVHGLTLGTVIRRVNQMISFDETDTAELLEAARAWRNQLQHGFIEQRIHQLQTAEGRCAVVAELEQAREIFEKADERITAVLAPVRIQLGVNDDETGSKV